MSLRPGTDGIVVETTRGAWRARAVVLATGGLSLPKTGSDGWGYDAARGLGHSIVPATPALVPLVLAPGEPGAIHRRLSGVSLPVRLALAVDGRIARRITGDMLWTHFGVSGPAALDLSRHWLRATLEARTVAVTASFRPEATFESTDRAWIDQAAAHPRLAVRTALSREVPESMAEAMLEELAIEPTRTLAALTREDRRRLAHALVAWPLPVVASRGYTYAEVTAGGVPLTEIDTATMASRACPGLYLVGEILDVDGRIGGFNFQWAWATGFLAGRGAAASLGAK